MKRSPLVYLLFLAIVYCVWAIYIFAINTDIFSNYTCWPVSLTMILGSLVAGSSAAGGGSVAYPILTLLLDVSPSVARDFSLAIQSIGMTAASLLIIGLKIKIEKNAIYYGSLGGLIGFLLGSYYLYDLIPVGNLKLIFASTWLSFGFALWLINRNKNRATTFFISNLNNQDKLKLIFFGIMGGCMTSFFGSGIDIMIFCLLTLHFNLSEKIATPTSVILMTINTLIGFFFHLFIIQDIEHITFSYWLAAVPVVALGAPLGAFIVNKLSRNSIAQLLYIIILMQFIGTIYVSKNQITINHIVVLITTAIVGFILFSILIKTRKINST